MYSMHLVHQPTAWLYRQYSTEYSTVQTVQYSTVQVMFDLQKIAWCIALASPLLPTWHNDRQGMQSSNCGTCHVFWSLNLGWPARLQLLLALWMQEVQRPHDVACSVHVCCLLRCTKQRITVVMHHQRPA